MAELSREAGLSRAVFSDGFARKVGVPPVEYLSAWRMALAKDMLQRAAPPLESVAAAIGYQSASAFSTAFRRQVGRSPRHLAHHPAFGGAGATSEGPPSPKAVIAKVV